jgi:hypothetical protein
VRGRCRGGFHILEAGPDLRTLAEAHCSS